jgi:hypothetical protein
VRLPRQLLDPDIGKDSGKRLGDIEVARALGADLEHHRDAKPTEALGGEVVPAQRTHIPQRCLGIGHDRGPEIGGAQLLRRDRQVSRKNVAAKPSQSPARASSSQIAFSKRSNLVQLEPPPDGQQGQSEEHQRQQAMNGSHNS